VGVKGPTVCLPNMRDVNLREHAPFYVSDNANRPYQPRTSPQVNPARLFQLMFGEYPGPGPN
jgi:phospholipid/cholesterol/gamma-HCH transport system substrate-binding protein